MHPLLVAALAFTVVMVAMATLTVLLFGFRQMARRTEQAVAAAGAAAAGPDGLAPELIAVLAAAAAAALEAPVVLHQVHVYRGPAADQWSRAGRMDIMVSHRVEPRR